MSSIENLSLPRRQRVFDANLVPAGDPLPLWTKLPLDSKLPVVPSPRGSYTLYTTQIGESKYLSKQRYDFDLYDAYCHARQGDYNSLHDPFLKTYFDKPLPRRQLVHNDLITPDGKVKCDIKEFNQYREFLRYRSATELALQNNRKKGEERGISPQRLVKSEDSRDKHGRSKDLQNSKTYSEKSKESNENEHLAMYGRDVSLVQRLRKREKALMKKLQERQRQREAEHERRVNESWEDRKRRQQRVLQREEEVDEQMRQERMRHVLQRERTLAMYREKFLRKKGKGSQTGTNKSKKQSNQKSEKQHDDVNSAIETHERNKEHGDSVQEKNIKSEKDVIDE